MSAFSSNYARRVAQALHERDAKQDAEPIAEVYESLCYDDPTTTAPNLLRLARTKTLPGLSIRFVKGLTELSSASATAAANDTAAAAAQLGGRQHLFRGQQLLHVGRLCQRVRRFRASAAARAE